MRTTGRSKNPGKRDSRMSHPIVTDVCLVAQDIERAIAFYTDKLGYTLKSRMPGFADFAGPGVILALWDAEKIRETTGVPAQTVELDSHAVMLAVRLESPSAIDQMYRRLLERGVAFYREPQDYPWNARCVYLAGPCGEFWEFFAWYDGGEPGLLEPVEQAPLIADPPIATGDMHD